jgi:rhamnosyltransferase
MGSTEPAVAVLLATHNAEPWLHAQLESIAAQRGVKTTTHASDDCSTDGTVALLNNGVPGLELQMLSALPHRLGTANRNFLRLIRDVHLGDAQYVALADHDDVWLPTKLRRAIEELVRTAADAYSSNVTAFWENGRERLIIKSNPQQRFDYLFESAGPGCTFVFTRGSFERLRTWVTSRFSDLQAIKVHDWLIYAYARSEHWRWHIDSESHMRYRQHNRNELGANVGMRAALRRWQQIRSGDFRRDVLAIARAINDSSVVTQALMRFAWIDRLHLLSLAHHLRRDRGQGVLLALFFLLMRPSR